MGVSMPCFLVGECPPMAHLGAASCIASCGLCGYPVFDEVQEKKAVAAIN